MTSLEALWDTLRCIRFCEFHSRSNSSLATGWSGSGSGVVAVESPFPGVLILRESGIWQPATGRPLRFHNSYRWTRQEESIRLEHLRFGEERPVFLFDLAPGFDDTWSSLTPHMCREDAYTAQLREDDETFVLAWTVKGPKKDEAIEYTYSLSREVGVQGF